MSASMGRDNSNNMGASNSRHEKTGKPATTRKPAVAETT